jgi:hypothetical protein
MTLTPCQFNKITTKEEFNGLKQKVDKMDVKFDTMLNTLDGIAKDVKDIKTEYVSNIAAHDRFEKRITKVERKVGMAMA